MADPRILHDHSMDLVFIDDIPSMIAKSKEINLDFAFDQEAMLKSARIRDAINNGAARLFYRASEVHLYFQMDANVLYGDRIIKAWGEAWVRG